MRNVDQLIRHMTFDEFSRSPGLRRQWSERIDPEANLYAMYSAPEYLDTLEPSARARCAALVAPVPGGREEVRCILQPHRARLQFAVPRVPRLAVAIDAVEVLGGQISGECSASGLDQMIAAAWRAYPDAGAIYIKSVIKGSALWNALEAARWRIGRSDVYRQYGERPFHYVQFPDGFDDYLEKFTAKQRYNLKRQVRRMTEAHGGRLEVRAAREPADVPFLVESARVVSQKSWRARRLAEAVPRSIERQSQLVGLAGEGILRSFILLADAVPCAFIVGYVYRGVFHYADLAYDESYAAHSPGAVLLFMVMQKLVFEERVRFINFGITDAQYKHMFGNRHTEDAEILIMRPGFRGRALIASHRTFSAGRRLLQAAYRRR